MENRSLEDVGGTPGGLGHFVLGFVMACLGGYSLANQVSVVGSYWSFFGSLLVPLPPTVRLPGCNFAALAQQWPCGPDEWAIVFRVSHFGFRLSLR
jgi:hypothetical protein